MREDELIKVGKALWKAQVARDILERQILSHLFSHQLVHHLPELHVFFLLIIVQRVAHSEYSSQLATCSHFQIID